MNWSPPPQKQKPFYRRKSIGEQLELRCKPMTKKEWALMSEKLEGVGGFDTVAEKVLRDAELKHFMDAVS